MQAIQTANDRDEAQQLALRIANLGTLLCSRICHDIAGPVGAIDNSLDFIEGKGNDPVKKQALSLLRDSAQFLSRSIRFYRLAFGASLGASSIRLSGAREIVCEFYSSTKFELEWPDDRVDQYALDKMSIKALVNMIYFIASFLPRYGTLNVDLAKDGKMLKVTVTGIGSRVQVPGSLSNLSELMEHPLGSAPENLTEAQVHLMILLVRACNGNVKFRELGDIENAPVVVEGYLPLI